MKRLYYLTKNVESAETISHHIHDAGITDWNFHVLSKNQSGLYKRHIHSANMIQKTDVVHRIEKGLLRGLVIGLGLALVLSQIPYHGSILSFGALFAILLASILLGGLHGSLSGYQSESYKIKPFHHKIEQGFFLIMIDVPASQVTMVEELMQSKHPEASYCNQDSTIVLPFDKAKEVCF